jgi:hypothetical protein
MRAILVFGKLYTPLSTIFIRVVFPSRDNSLLETGLASGLRTEMNTLALKR